MRRVTLTAALSFVTALTAGSCLVSSFDKVDHFPGSDASAGSGGSSGDAQAGSGGKGGSIGGNAGTGGSDAQADAANCNGTACPAGAQGEPACCTTLNECGIVVKEYGNACLPLNGQGAADGSCAPNTSPALAGCCTPEGLCGFVDTTHNVGCFPREALADAASCGSPGCGLLCLDALAINCSIVNKSLPMPVETCAKQCGQVLGACGGDVTAVLQKKQNNPSTCTEDNDPLYADALQEELDLYQCLQRQPDCGIYCAMVAACGASPNEPQFTTDQQCFAFCIQFNDSDPVLTRGNLGDNANSIGCRLGKARDAYLGNVVPNETCPIAGPGGSVDSGLPNCGVGICETYCALYQRTCPTEFTAEHSDAGTCLNQCMQMSNVAYKVPVPSGPSVQCRMQAVIKSLGDAALCSDVPKCT